MTRCQLRGTRFPVSSFSNAQTTHITSRPLTLFPLLTVISFLKGTSRVCLRKPSSHNSPLTHLLLVSEARQPGQWEWPIPALPHSGLCEHRNNEQEEESFWKPLSNYVFRWFRMGVVGPDLWWGSSAYRAEPAESSSVDKPALRGNLQPKKRCKPISPSRTAQRYKRSPK